MAKLEFVGLAVLVYLLVPIGGLLTLNVTPEEHIIDLVETTKTQDVSLAGTHGRAKKLNVRNMEGGILTPINFMEMERL